ncbi:hypothetical protein [Pseudomonas sp. NBRC 111118]|uniref:hypothetical protein n=1 Tax=Pseudomonas sp. NBRC 111118 TaxID=1661033 RepID=UPI0006D46065|nr:hypothetical protein [Pseudomonas sp. NBRC 111118]
MSKVRDSEKKIIAEFQQELIEKFKSLDVYQRGLDAIPIVFNQQVEEVHGMHHRIKSFKIVGVVHTHTKLAVQYEVHTNNRPYHYEIGFKVLPMYSHTVH